MALLSIRLYGDPVLKQTAQPIEEITDHHRELATNMAETMYANSGIGLAANQIGVLERIIVVDVKWARSEDRATAPRNPVAMINPEVIEESIEDDTYDEGCLSLPGINGEVWRPVGIKVRYKTLEGKVVEKSCKGLLARCIQHEVDHLNGVLFIERMGKAKRFMLSRSLNKLLQAQAEGKTADQLAEKMEAS